MIIKITLNLILNRTSKILLPTSSHLGEYKALVVLESIDLLGMGIFKLFV
jgi:hypothetical protein